MSLAPLIFSVARRFGDRPAATDPVGTLTYAELIDRVARLARAMHLRGVRPGHRVVLFMENSTAFLEVLLATWTAGLVAVPVNPKLHEREVSFVAENSSAKFVFTTAGLIPDLGAFCAMHEGVFGVYAGSDGYEAMVRSDPMSPVQRGPHDPAWIFYTSGTTGRPKGAILSHRNLIFMSQAYYADVGEVDERDTKLHAAPMSHGSGLYGLPHLLKGCHQVIHNGFDTGAIFDALARYERVTLFAAPTMLVRLVADPGVHSADIKNLKTIYYGGGPTYLADLKRAVDVFGPRLFQLYGQGETPMTATGLTKAMHGNPEFLSTCGIARTGVEVRVVDENDHELPPGQIGEVVTRSDCVMQGYLGNEEASATALRNGWLHTGDIGSMDDRGLLTLHDRSKDMIISGGSNIYPREVEEALISHPGVVEAAVVGRLHPEWGEEVVAFVACKPGLSVSAAELDKVCLEQIARFKRPKHYRFVEALPKNNYGKVLKTELRARLRGEESE
ncbi:class I adenylate-forming enzyme family protein [Bradyrhizobium cenepequi]|uniref:class I adenylate-forming enzyme family protein n=1 Tax=Bradyrhizobium cenepequi TaxID=2821403 RepID=UPI001CE350B5|nr:AMP-binding protein [Bradyrhizobium cenepequi]MCA6113127.1 AMP-binding protein [Bradyrhizobium cenepequi]